MLPGTDTPGAGPGFAGKPPRRPRGKTASPEASAAGRAALRRSGSVRRGCAVKITTKTAPRPANAITGEPQDRVQVGWGSQIDDADAPSPFEQTVDERAEDADETRRQDQALSGGRPIEWHRQAASCCR